MNRPVRPRSADADIELVEMRLGAKRPRKEAPELGFTVEVRIRPHPSESLARAFVAPKANAPCRGGVADGGAWIDDVLVAERPRRVRDSHRVELEFAYRETLDAMRDGSFVDVELVQEAGEARCLRTALASDPEFPLEARPGWSFGGPLRVRVPVTSVYNTSSATTFEGSLGRWVGPLYLDVSAGLGFGSCRSCPEKQDGFIGLPIGLHAADYVQLGNRYALGLGVGYAAIPALFPDHAIWFHAPRASLTLATGSPAPAGFPSNVRSEALGLELFAERWIYRLEGRTEQATVLGLGLSFSGAM
ncbi:MAG TPA: hypothetical protein VJT73_16165 [Polyangiaceae bacterium]|nr:hypothetical protein [Polyangiaceae bacterium]